MRTFWKTMNRAYEKTMLLIFIIALLICIYALYDTWYVFDHANDKSYLKFKPGVEEENGAVSESPITSDMVGWITMDDTNIDYPIMQGEDNTEYLNKDPYGKFSLSGSIFLDSRNNSAFTDEYSLIYGHHMEYGVMFGALDDYLDEDYLQSHRHGQLLVGRDGKVMYELEAFYAMSADANGHKPSGIVSQHLRGRHLYNEDRSLCIHFRKQLGEKKL